MNTKDIIDTAKTLVAGDNGLLVGVFVFMKKRSHSHGTLKGDRYTEIENAIMTFSSRTSSTDFIVNRTHCHV